MFSNESSSGNGKFAHFKDGQIVTKIDGQKQSFTTISGNIVDVDIADETYQGKEYRKVTLFIFDGTDVCALGFPLSSGYGWSFFQLCGNIDPKKPVAISGGSKEIPNSGGKKYGSMFVKQDGKFLKHLMPKDSEAAKKIPDVPVVKVGKESVKNYEKRDAYMEKVITAFYTKVQKAHPKGAEIVKAAKAASKPTADEVNEPIDDLPFF